MKRFHALLFTIIFLNNYLLGAPVRPQVEREDAREEEILGKIGSLVAAFAHLASSGGGPGNTDPHLLGNVCQQLFSLISAATLNRHEIAHLLLTPEGKEKVLRLIHRKMKSIKS